MTIKKILFCCLFFSFNLALASTPYDYTTLLFLDYNDLRPIVYNAVKESRSFNYPEDGERATGPLKKALIMLLSRPDSDNLIAKLSPDLISDLESMGIFKQTVDSILENGKKSIYNKNLPKKVRTTNLLMINNLLLLIRPMTLDNTGLAKSVCQLADSKDIELPKDLLSNTELTTMMKEPDPTKLAQRIMLWYARKKGVEVKITNHQQGCPFAKKA